MPNRPAASVRAFLLALLLCLPAGPASALVHFDFEQAYLVHRGRQVWDFCLVRHEGTYHCFYHGRPEGTALADTIWHATAPDLTHWQIQGPALVAGAWYEVKGTWAPDVAFDSTTGRWVMAYTGADDRLVQRACLAWSDDLTAWTREPANPVFAPDSTVYRWSPTLTWSAFRDPALFRQDGLWQMLSTAMLRGPDDAPIAVIHRAESPDLVNWSEGGVVLRHDYPYAWRALESCQVVEREGWRHVFFTEFDVPGTQHVANDSLGWRWADRNHIDWGNAPEIKSFDPGATVFGRLAIGQYPLTGDYFYTVRFDTMEFLDGGLTPRVLMPHPLDGVWEERTGTASLAQPTFGDNPVMRGEPSCGLVGNGWYGSREYFQGPLSGRGGPGVKLGDTATGGLRSFPFTLEGNTIRLRVGGGRYPQTCYVALVDAATDSILFKETGRDEELMSPRSWYTRRQRGRLVRLVIVDNEGGAFGRINVDEIEETMDFPAGVIRVTTWPDSLAAGWLLTGPAGWDTTGTGSAVISSWPAGDYVLDWLDVPGWQTPAPDPVLGSLAAGDTLSFDGAYVELGTVTIDVGPSPLQPCWHLIDPDSTVHPGCGDATLVDLPPGDYAIDWLDVPFWLPPESDLARATLAPGGAIEFAGAYRPLPSIAGVADVGNDQGRRVRLTWNRCAWDAPGDSVVVTGYGVYRRQDGNKAAGAREALVSPDGRKLGGWDWLATVPARTDDVYQYVAETLCDSTAAAGICWSVFMVSAMTPDPAQFYDSPPDSGYSLDNLAPSVPAGLAVSYGSSENTLAWLGAPEPDVWHYRVYRSRQVAGGCAPRGDPIALVAGGTWTDDLTGAVGGAVEQCYCLTAVDFGGNESVASEWEHAVLTGVTGPDLPVSFRLHPNYPNPFNPLTRVSFDLPASVRVDLAVYDLAGRVVRTLVDGRILPAGRHELTWTGSDDAGRRLATGVYFLRLTAGEFRQTRRMALLK